METRMWRLYKIVILRPYFVEYSYSFSFSCEYYCQDLTFRLIDFIGYETESEKVAMIMQVIFITCFINTGFLGLLTNANFEYTPVLKYLLPIQR